MIVNYFQNDKQTLSYLQVVSTSYGSRAVDGNTEPTKASLTYVETSNRERFPWFAVDLGQVYRVTDVVIYNVDSSREFKYV